jgi:hypothetical protein
MTRVPPKQLRRKVATDPIRVQPSRRCKVIYQAPMAVPSALPLKRPATAESLDPHDNKHSGVKGRRSESQQQTASKLVSRNIPLAASLAHSVIKVTKSVTAMSQRSSKSNSPVVTKDTHEARNRVPLGPHTQRANRRRIQRTSEKIDVLISAESPQQLPIGIKDSSPSVATVSLRKLRNSRTSEPHGSTLEQGTSKSAQFIFTKPRARTASGKASSREVSVSEIAGNQVLTHSTTATITALPLSNVNIGLAAALEPEPGPSNKQVSGTTWITADTSLPIPEGHKLVHIVRHCRAWHK